jgi:hypothetical protein
MAGYQPRANWRVDPFDDVDDDGDIDDWMARRNAAIAVNQDADVAGRQAWVDAIRNGQNIQAPNPSDIVAVGMRSLQNRQTPAQGSQSGGGGQTSSLIPQTPSPATFPIPSIANGYVPGLLGDLSALTDQASQHAASAFGDDQTNASDVGVDQAPAADSAEQQPDPVFDTGLATDGDATWIPAGGKTPGQRRRWSQHYGQDWPRVPGTGENFHLHHFTPKADGGGEELDNYGPMEPSAHRQHHIDNGDFPRWAKRWWLGKPAPPEVEGLGAWQSIPDITGILSGRIRTDSMDNFFSDMLGVPSQEDIQQYHEQIRKKFAPNLSPGTVVDVL